MFAGGQRKRRAVPRPPAAAAAARQRRQAVGPEEEEEDVEAEFNPNNPYQVSHALFMALEGNAGGGGRAVRSYLRTAGGG